MSAPPPEDPDERSAADEHEPAADDELDFDAEFERLVANWTPSSVEPSSSVEPVETNPPPPVEPVETSDERLRNLFRGAWPDQGDSAEALGDPEEHYVPPPAPPLPRPEPPRLLAWLGVVGAPLLALLLLVLGVLPHWGAFFLFCWFVGGFGYLVATMGSDGRDGWDDGARV